LIKSPAPKNICNAITNSLHDSSIQQKKLYSHEQIAKSFLIVPVTNNLIQSIKAFVNKD
jgi:hypothetical protein